MAMVKPCGKPMPRGEPWLDACKSHLDKTPQPPDCALRTSSHVTYSLQHQQRKRNGQDSVIRVEAKTRIITRSDEHVSLKPKLKSQTRQFLSTYLLEHVVLAQPLRQERIPSTTAEKELLSDQAVLLFGTAPPANLVPSLTTIVVGHVNDFIRNLRLISG